MEELRAMSHSDLPLSGRVAVVTGVSRRIGIGFAIAERLLEMGASVFAQSWTPHDSRMPWGADPVGIERVIDELRAMGAVEHADATSAIRSRRSRSSMPRVRCSVMSTFWLQTTGYADSARPSSSSASRRYAVAPT
jgi:NAD(P)-dependent dehydrogenase (short-subunit alcohol dehydrogenase family)